MAVTALNIRGVDRNWLQAVKVAAYVRGMTSKSFCLAAIEAARIEPVNAPVTAGDKLAAALPRITAVAKVPMHLQTASTLEGERTVERDEYAQD